MILKKIKSLWIVRIIWRDACINFGKDLEISEPGETQLSIGILLPKYYKDHYGKRYYRLIQNYGEKQDDGTDIPVGWAIDVQQLVKIPFEFIKIEQLMKVKLKNRRI